MEEILQELVEFVKTASPVIWQALYRQVYVEALSFILWAIGLIVLTIVLVRFAKWAMVKKENDGYMSDWGIVYLFSYIFAITAGVVAFGFLISAVKWISNPDYYAIRIILQSIGGG